MLQAKISFVLQPTFQRVLTYVHNREPRANFEQQKNIVN